MEVLSRFKWGHSFFSINADILDRYASCRTSDQVLAVQSQFLAQASRVPRRGRLWDGARTRRPCRPRRPALSALHRLLLSRGLCGSICYMVRNVTVVL